MKLSEWKSYFEDRGISADLINDYLRYIKTLAKNNQPVIFEFEHLSMLLGIELEYLAKMIASSHSFYRKFSIPKRSGGTRDIFAPYESLLLCQRWVLENILNNISIHPAAHGFTTGKSIKTNASEHLNSKSMLKMDVKDFFPSIPQSWVVQIFKEIGYSPNVAFYLSALCCYDEKLAQGAATSPALSNIALRSLDNRLTRLSKKSSLNYTRYADDFTFSGDRIHSSFANVVTKIVEEFGLKINEKKTRLKSENGTKIVTGISILNGDLAIPRDYKRKIKNELFFIKKFGFLGHVTNQKINDPNYLSSVLGRISFWLFIEPENETALNARETILRLMRN